MAGACRLQMAARPICRHMISITDTHQHLIDPAFGVYAWAGGIPQLAARKFAYATIRPTSRAQELPARSSWRRRRTNGGMRLRTFMASPQNRGGLAYTRPGAADLTVLRPFIEHVIGWNRVVWGSDWPVVLMRSTLRDWVAIARELVSGESEANQSKLFH